MKPPLILMPIALLGLVAGVIGVLLAALDQYLSFAAIQTLLVIAAASCVLMSYLSLRRSLSAGRGYSRLGSLLFGGGVLIAVVLPGIQLVSGSRTSLLSRIGGPAVVLPDDVTSAYVLFLVALCSFVVGQEGIAALRRNTPASDRGTRRASRLLRSLDTRRTYVALLVVGLLGEAALHSGGSLASIFASRGTVRGTGLLFVASYGVPAGISMGVLHRHWHSRVLACLSIVSLVLFELQSGDRSPLLLIGLAVMLRFLAGASRRGRGLRYLLSVTVVLYLGAVLLVAVGSWRGAVATGSKAPLTSFIVDSLSDPVSKLDAAGLGTLDGMILSAKVNPQRVGATWFDPAKAFATLVPYQLWPDKPTFLSADVTHAYTDFGGNSGIFLSGPGYFFIVYRGALGMSLACCVVGAVFESVVRRSARAGTMLAIFVYGLVRLLFGGDPAFDLSHALSVALLVIGVSVVVQVVIRTGPRAVHRLPQSSFVAS